RECQIRNNELLRNQYYKIFLLYRKDISYFSKIFIFSYIIFLLYFDNYFLDALSSFYIWIWTKPSHRVYFIFHLFLLYFLRDLVICKTVLYIIDVARMLWMKRAVFDVPI